MIFISDIHHGLSGLEELPKDKGPLVILGDLINWIDYRNGEGIAKDVFGEEGIERGSSQKTWQEKLAEEDLES